MKSEDDQSKRIMVQNVRISLSPFSLFVWVCITWCWLFTGLFKFGRHMQWAVEKMWRCCYHTPNISILYPPAETHKTTIHQEGREGKGRPRQHHHNHTHRLTTISSLWCMYILTKQIHPQKRPGNHLLFLRPMLLVLHLVCFIQWFVQVFGYKFSKWQITLVNFLNG